MLKNSCFLFILFFVKQKKYSKTKLYRLTLRLKGVKMNQIQQYEKEAERVAETKQFQVARPPMYKVVLMNDDFTPMDFVIAVLEVYFFKKKEEATEIMWQVHTQGKGVCGVFSRDIAESKVTQVNDVSRLNDVPLLCAMEKE